MSATETQSSAATGEKITKTFAEKPLTKVVLLFYVVLTIFCAASCSAGASGKLKQIPSDVDYDFVIFNRDNLVINGVHYDINELARKISGKKNRNYIKFSVLIGDFLYYSYEYGSRRGIFGNGDDNYGYNRGRIIIKNENDETLYDNPENGNLSYVTYIYDGFYFFSVTEKSDPDNPDNPGNPDNSGETAPA